MLIALHKPYGILSQFTAEVPGQKTLSEYGLPTAVYPVGRLDRDSEGLLLLTDDNKLKSFLLEPRRKTPKTYLVQVDGLPNTDALTALRTGVKIRIKKRLHHTAPAEVEVVDDPDLADREPPIRYRKSIPTTWLRLTITEGKNRQVRRMCASVGHPVLRLIRVALGPYRLDTLAAGKWVQLEA